MSFDLPDQLHALGEDWDHCMENFRKERSQFWKRTSFRAGFALLEGLNSWVRTLAFHCTTVPKNGSVNISRLSLLGEHIYRIGHTGKLETDELRESFLPYTAFLLRTMAEENGASADFFADDGWNKLQIALKTRHKITHPKASHDLDVSDDDVFGLNQGIFWYFRALATAVPGGLEELERVLDEPDAFVTCP